MGFTATKTVLKYRSKKNRLVSKTFKTFKAAFDYAAGHGMSEFEIDRVRYFNI